VTITNPDLEAFGRLVDSLTPWLDQIVIIGGWAHRLYRFHLLAQQLDYPPLMTLDADVALPSGLKVKGQDIHERLIANGFQAEFLGHHKPPATHYRLSTQSSGFYVDFLTPLIGGAYARGGKKSATTRIAGVASQKLRHVDLLLRAPWTVVLSASDGFPFAEGKRVLVANPVSFLAQKVLVHRKRNRSDRAKDILYIHDTLETFGARIADLRAEWTNKIRSSLHARNVRLVEQAAGTLFGGMSDSVREASRVAHGRTLSPEAIREVCSFGFKQVFRSSD
jgi:hypothetical protein